MQATDILAGPILRRVERDLVTVWVALSAPATVDIEVFRGQGTRGDLQPVPRRAAAAPTDTQTIRIGEHLHCVVSIWEPAETVGLNPGELYSYDLLISPTGDTPAAARRPRPAQRPRCRAAVVGARLPGRLLPSFATVPNDIADLKLSRAPAAAATSWDGTPSRHSTT